jgi:4-carboxymuconolactone decarboxylase
MSDLSPRELELVALGAAMGSNCAPCIEFHIPESRRAGLSDLEIHAAILHADKIRQVPARKTLQTALKLLPSVAVADVNAGTSQDCGCGLQNDAGQDATKDTLQPLDSMAAMMSKMMANCGTPAQPTGNPGASKGRSTADSATSGSCGCN